MKKKVPSKRNIIHRVHDAMNEYLDQYEIRPWFIYLGEKEYKQVTVSQNLFCPSEYLAFVSTEKIFKMEVVIVKRNSFLKVG